MCGENFMKIRGGWCSGWKNLQMDLKVIAGMRPFSAINYIRKGVAYEDYLREYADVRRIPFEDLKQTRRMSCRKMPEDLKLLKHGLNTSNSCGKNWRNRPKVTKNDRWRQLKYITFIQRSGIRYRISGRCKRKSDAE